MMKTGNAHIYPIEIEPQARQSTGLLITGSAVRARPEEPFSSANHTRRLRPIGHRNTTGTSRPVRLFQRIFEVSRETSVQGLITARRPRTLAATVSALLIAACSPAPDTPPETYAIDCNGHIIETTDHYDQTDPDTTWYRVNDHYEPAGRGVLCTRVQP